MATNNELNLEGSTTLVTKNSDCQNYSNDYLIGTCQDNGDFEVYYHNKR